MWQWMGNLFYRRQQISEIKKLRFAEMREWNKWHEIMIQQEKKIIEGNKNNA
jgi:hypothetical protein